jgi:hypothetical protein
MAAMQPTFFADDFVKVSLDSPDVTVHVEIGQPERESVGMWVTSLSITLNHEIRHRCVGADPQNALWHAFARLYEEFSAELDRGSELTRPGDGGHRFDLKTFRDLLAGEIPFPADLVARAEPSADALLLWLKPLIDDSMLREIAEADYGIDADLNFERLVLIRDGGKVVNFEGHLREVLELTRWSPTDGLDGKSPDVARRGNLKSAFACSVLLCASVEAQNRHYDFAFGQTMSLLLATVVEFAGGAREVTVSLLAWLVECAMFEDRAVSALAFLMLGLSVMRDRWSDEEVGRLAEWVTAEEARTRNLPHYSGPAWGWFWHQIVSSEEWRIRAESLLEEAAKIDSEVARRPLEDLALQLLTAP